MEVTLRKKYVAMDTLIEGVESMNTNSANLLGSRKA